MEIFKFIVVFLSRIDIMGSKACPSWSLQVKLQAIVMTFVTTNMTIVNQQV